MQYVPHFITDKLTSLPVNKLLYSVWQLHFIQNGSTAFEECSFSPNPKQNRERKNTITEK